MDNMWRKLQKIVMDFQSDTEEKRRNYNELLSKDKKGVAEVAENNKKIQRLMVSHQSWDFFVISIQNSLLKISGRCWKTQRDSC